MWFFQPTSLTSGLLQLCNDRQIDKIQLKEGIDFSQTSPLGSTLSCHHFKRICPTESEVHRTSNIKCCRTVQPHAKALDKEWKLHVVYLKQAKYFESLFSERWHIKNERLIELEIPDSNIDTHSLDTVFGSLYCDNVQVKPQRAVNVR